MAATQHQTTLGNWFFQAIVSSDKLNRMATSEKAADENKPRLRRQLEEVKVSGVRQTIHDLDASYFVILSGVRVIRRYDNRPEVHPTLWFGAPQVAFPTGPGLPPFTQRPVCSATACAFGIRNNFSDRTDEDWYGLDFGSPSGTFPSGRTYTVVEMLGDAFFPRVAVARPIETVVTGAAAYGDITRGLRFKILYGRLGGTDDSPDDATPGFQQIVHYIHWTASGTVAAY